MKTTITCVAGEHYDVDLLTVTQDGVSRTETRTYWLDQVIHIGKMDVNYHGDVPRTWRTEKPTLQHGQTYTTRGGTLVRIRRERWDCLNMAFAVSNGVFMGMYHDDGRTVEGEPSEADIVLPNAIA